MAKWSTVIDPSRHPTSVLVDRFGRSASTCNYTEVPSSAEGPLVALGSRQRNGRYSIMREKRKKIQYCTVQHFFNFLSRKTDFRDPSFRALPVAYCQTINFPMMVPVSVCTPRLNYECYEKLMSRAMKKNNSTINR